jgi:hypothetical protein
VFPVGQAREALRRALGTYTLDEPGRSADYGHAQARARKTSAGSSQPVSLPPEPLARIAAEAADLDGALYLGFTDTPFVLVLQPDDAISATDFLHSVRAEQIPVELAFGGRSSAQGEWVLTSREGRLSFRIALPPQFEPWVLGPVPDTAYAPERGTGSRTVTISVDGEDAELVFPPLVEVRESAGPTDEDDQARDYARAARLTPGLAFRSEEEVSDAAVTWSAEAVHELLRRLRLEGWPHADIIEYAARHGGVVTREQVYELANYRSDRMLRGFTRPCRRITLDLMVESLLQEDASWPLLTQYSSGVLASHFTVPPEFTSILAD